MDNTFNQDRKPGAQNEKIQNETAQNEVTPNEAVPSEAIQYKANPNIATQYETVIGLEVHVELATKTKIFCGCSTVFGGRPNTLICPVCTGMPGALPVLNKAVLEHAIAVGLALNCEITKEGHFDRKNYFYPDNPQNYQISQLYHPIGKNGYVEIENIVGVVQQNYTDERQLHAEGEQIRASEGQAATKRIRIHELHMEEDAGKLVHDEITGATLIDYNRSGVPLIEIVSEHDMRTADDVIAYLEKLQSILRYLGASDCKLQEGSMRADVNLSVRKMGTSELGTRTEMKNLASFTAIRKAIAKETERQIRLLESGQRVVQETRRFDEDKEESFSMRSKEDAKDYRYFPDPDLPPVIITDDMISKMRQKQPEFREAKKIRYAQEYEIPAYDIDQITASKALADFFEATVALGAPAKKVSNWIMVETMRLLKEKEMDPEELRVSPKHLAKLIAMTDQKVINGGVAKEVYEEMFVSDIDPEQYVADKGLGMVQNTAELENVIQKVLNENPKSVEDYRSGKGKAIGFLVGQTMKATGGKADPGLVTNMLKQALTL